MEISTLNKILSTTPSKILEEKPIYTNNYTMYDHLFAVQ